jgi:hypothetical protein
VRGGGVAGAKIVGGGTGEGGQVGKWAGQGPGGQGGGQGMCV